MAINISLFDNWRIKSDKHNYILVREENQREFTEGYYNSLNSCVQSFINKKIRGFNATSINGLLNSIKTLQTALNKCLTPLKIEIKEIDNSGNS